MNQIDSKNHFEITINRKDLIKKIARVEKQADKSKIKSEALNEFKSKYLAIDVLIKGSLLHSNKKMIVLIKEFNEPILKHFKRSSNPDLSIRVELNPRKFDDFVLTRRILDLLATKYGNRVYFK